MYEPGAECLTDWEGGLSEDLVAEGQAGVREEPVDHRHRVQEVQVLVRRKGYRDDQHGQCYILG